MNNSGWNMYVFRNGKQSVSGSEMTSSLTQALLHWRSAPREQSEDSVLAALIAAGELECALLDSAGDERRTHSCDVASEITEALSLAFLTGKRDALATILQKTKQLQVAKHYELAVQEGFAYYALHPRKIAMMLDTLPLTNSVAVLGIRSIGVTLSAVTLSALRLLGIECRRITVRPTGHPYDRRLELTPKLRKWVEDAGDAGFLIVDEGPGISGSSFLAVAEALAACGVSDDCIQMIGSRDVDPGSLRAENAVERWPRFKFHVMQSAPLPPLEAGESLSGGTWRRHFRCDGNSIPASWAPLEAAKFLARDERSIFKFEGFGHYGQAASARAESLAAQGFSLPYLGHSCGFGQFGLVPGRTLSLDDLSAETLERMADYLSFRATEFASNIPQTPEIEKMLRWNWQVEFGEELGDAQSHLEAAQIVVCDGRMMPCKWLRADTGELLKLDACKHGNNHFFPGPCDIAWDVAGTIVEWELQGETRDYFIHQFETRSGFSVADRLAPYLLAYVTFRLGWSKMAALAMQGEFDESLLTRDYERYRATAMRLRQEPAIIDTEEKSATANSSLRNV
jgi:hypothetical protein